MNTHIRVTNRIAGVAIVVLALTACSASPTRPDGADSARNRLTQLQSQPQLANLAPVEIKEADLAVRAAEVPRKDADLAKHLVIIADMKVDIAQARAQGRLYEDQRVMLSQESETARLDSRTREADMAARDARSARTEADIARSETDIARAAADMARQEADDLQRQITELNARETDRGLVMTLGDVLFETGRSDLRGGSATNLDKLAVFLQKYQDRNVVIEGHTDSIGTDEYNYSLSQRRADSVRSYLVSQGVNSQRLATLGKGKGSPVASNETTTGRQQNRRVEIIISNARI
ncbi:MAG: OmpA family protein [Gammaproteobacteria bacterium]